jgi:hypothetical protein
LASSANLLWPLRSTGKAYLGLRPSKKSIRCMVEHGPALTHRQYNVARHQALVHDLNRSLRGWAICFQVASDGWHCKRRDCCRAIPIAGSSG